MNTTLQEGVKLAEEVNAAVKAADVKCDVVICVPFTHLASISEKIDKNALGLGAENCADHKSGAYTGEVSAPMVASTGANYVILGHSERRADHCEINEIVQKKARAAHENGLKTIICIGESEAERDAGKALDVCTKQISGSVPDNATAADTVIAYEPIWAIGTGKTPTPADVEEVHAAVRKALAKKLGKAQANKMRILYGGSVKPGNAKEFLSLPDVDGALIGGASLKTADFLGIAKNAGCC